jgi:hypothetical protein
VANEEHSEKQQHPKRKKRLLQEEEEPRSRSKRMLWGMEGMSDKLMMMMMQVEVWEGGKANGGGEKMLTR